MIYLDNTHFFLFAESRLCSLQTKLCSATWVTFTCSHFFVTTSQESCCRSSVCYHSCRLIHYLFAPHFHPFVLWDMNKGSLLAWWREVHIRKDRFHLTLLDVPHLGRFVQFSNKFRFNMACQVEVLELRNALGLHFSDYIDSVCCPVNTLWSVAEDPVVMENIGSEGVNKCQAHCCQESADDAQTYDTMSSQDSSPTLHPVFTLARHREKTLSSQRR